MIAGHPSRFGQKVECILNEGLPVALAVEIATRVDAAIGDPEVGAAAILLPQILALDAAAKVFLALIGQVGWTVTTSILQDPPAGEMVAVHVVRAIPFGRSSCPSEALVLGPFPEFPPTRRAPVTAIELYVGKPLANDPKSGDATTKANLAHMAMPQLNEMAFKKTWNKSVEGRTRSLGGNDSRAKAKISFVIPKVLADQLRCAQ
jgi:hypothetical protein